LIEAEVRELWAAGLEREAERRLEAWVEVVLEWAEEKGLDPNEINLSLA
jgi:hypothetical protein